MPLIIIIIITISIIITVIISIVIIIISIIINCKWVYTRWECATIQDKTIQYSKGQYK